MTASQVTVLRKENKIAEALTLVQQLLSQDHSNIWNKRAAAWVYIELLKQDIEKGGQSFLVHVRAIQELDLSKEEVLVFEHLCWCITKKVYSLPKGENILPEVAQFLTQVWSLLQQMPYPLPSKGYSSMLNAFLQFKDDWRPIINFIDWWGWESFLEEDYLESTFQDKKLMALVEKVYIAYAKKLLEGTGIDGATQQCTFDVPRIERFLERIAIIARQQPHYQYPTYFQAKLLALIGRPKEALIAFLPFGRKKQNDFWVWDFLGELHKHEPETQFACYCKALSIKAPDKMVIGVRKTLVPLLLERKLHNEARTEVDQIIAVNKANGWPVKSPIANWVREGWYTQAQSLQHNKRLYQQYVSIAEQVLVADIPTNWIVVGHVNAEKKMLSFIKNKQEQGFFNYSSLALQPKVGDILEVRFAGSGDKGFYKVLSAQKTNDPSRCQAIKHIENKVYRQSKDKSFGFVDNVFVEPLTVSQFNLKDGDSVNGIAILTLDKKKNEWGWRLIKVNR